MKVIKPVLISDAQLISSTVPEPDTGEVAWVSGTTYTTGDLRYRATTHRFYRRLTSSAGTTPPEIDYVNWIESHPTNRWAMFDQSISTQTVETVSPLTVVVAPGKLCNSLAIIGVVGVSALVEVRDGLAGPVVYSRTISLERSVCADWYGYFFEPFSQKTSVVLTDLPPYGNAHITVSISGGGAVACGGLVLGTANYIGAAQFGAAAGIRDYSRKDVDIATGAVRLEVRKFAKMMRAQLQLPGGSVNAVHQVLTDLRATACVWIGDDSGDIEPLSVFGFYRDFQLSVSYPTVSYYSLEIEGMA
jgi:hypothetical protein